MDEVEKKRFFGSMIFPALLVILLWLIKLIEAGFNTSFSEYGLLPQSLIGLRGILFSPLLHGDWAHLAANSVPLFMLTAALFYYYGKKARSIFVLSWLVTGLWVWIFAYGAGIHIGASGVVYALATFHFTSGILRREPRMMAFSLLVVFLYGGLVWGIIPDFYPKKNISWESHLLGGLAGILLAWAYRNEGPQRKIYIWDEEEGEEIEYVEEDTIEIAEPENKLTENQIEKPESDQSAGTVDVNYIYTKKE